MKLVLCHSPARWLYLPGMYLGENGSWVHKFALLVLAKYLKSWDVRAALSCDRYFAVSTVIRQRIADAYGIDAAIMPPPVSMPAVDNGEPVPELGTWLGQGALDGAYYLCVSRLLPYKNVEQIVRAFAGSPRRLVVVGRGPDEHRIRRIMTDNVLLLSDLTDAQMVWLYQRCRATIAASYEDFGLTPIEAGVWGRPSAVLRWGGFLDTVVEGVTGVFFDEPRPDDIAKALDRLEFETFDPENIRRAMERWSESRFSRALHFAIQDALARRRSPFRDNHR
jgi:glycosyltransferase involved in cell wall biosynthesis